MIFAEMGHRTPPYDPRYSTHSCNALLSRAFLRTVVKDPGVCRPGAMEVELLSLSSVRNRRTKLRGGLLHEHMHADRFIEDAEEEFRRSRIAALSVH